ELKTVAMKSPFEFPDSYTREDEEIFFGRDREIEELYRKVFESKTLLVYGISGTGKTSLIDCGLVNKGADWLPAQQQGIMPEEKYREWKGDLEQVDDVVVSAISIQ
ncbi:MAG: ATP-binding protein, partial [Bacteroidales bacterium]